MSPNRRTVYSAVVVIVTVAIIAYFVVTEGSIDALRDVDGATMLALLVSATAVLVVRGIQLAGVATPFGVRLGIGESVGLSALHTLSNYLPGRAGIFIRGAYLRQFHGLAVADYTAMTALWLVGSLLSAVVVGLATALSTALPVPSGRTLVAFALMGGALVGGFLALEWLASHGRGTGRVAQAVQRIHGGLSLWRSPGKWRAWFGFWSVVLLLVSGARFWFALRTVTPDASYAAAVVVQAFVAVSLLVSITPGNIGIREGIAVFAASLAGVDADDALLAAVIERAVILVPAVFGFLLLGRPLAQRLHRSRPDATDAA